MTRHSQKSLPQNTPARLGWGRHCRRGFTLMEVLVVIAIIVALAGISVVVGGAVKRQMTRKATKATLDTLQQVMDEYLKAANPEPAITTADPDPPTTGLPANSPPTDRTVYVKALIAFGRSKVENIPHGNEGGNMTLLDGYDNAIRFVPSTVPPAQNPSGRPYFFSVGADGKAFTSDDVSSLD